MASFRYRTQLPAEQLGASINEGEGEVVIFSKPSPRDAHLAGEMRGQGAIIIVDVCDPHFEEMEWYEEVCSYAHVCVAPTKTCAEIVHKYTQKPVAIIPDPYELEECAPHADGEKTVWFGHNVNLEDIKPYTEILDRIVTGPKVADGQTHWSIPNLKRALSEANWALFPTRKGVEYKSNNRLINAIRAGVFPICSAHPSYEELRKSIWLGGPPTGLRWAKENKSTLNELVAEAQEQIRDQYSPERIGGLWKGLIESI